MTARATLAEARPEPGSAAPLPRCAAPATARQRVLALQRTAGNAAVRRALARDGRRRLARQPLAPALTRAEEIAASRRSEGEVTAVEEPPTISLYAFTIDDATLKPRHRALLAELRDVLGQLPPGAVNVMVVGHADATGEPAVNDPLSARRAAAVARALRGLRGVRVETAARGENEPFTTDETVEGRERNRRVDVIVLPAAPLGRRPIRTMILRRRHLRPRLRTTTLRRLRLRTTTGRRPTSRTGPTSRPRSHGSPTASGRSASAIRTSAGCRCSLSTPSGSACSTPPSALSR